MDDENLINADDENPELFEHHRFECDPGQSLLRVDKFLADRIRNASRSKIQAAAEAGNILINGQPVKSNQRVKPLDTVTVVLEFPPHDYTLVAEDIPLNIVYEDDDLMLINKPAGMVVHPGIANYSGTLVNALAYYFKDSPMFNGDDPRPGLVHRIDKDTTGLMVIAKNELAKNKLARQFFEKTSERTYYALVWGYINEPSGTVRGKIGRNLKDRIGMDVFDDDSDYGKDAVTHFEVIERFGYVTLVKCNLETGRTHQIRVHMKHIGHPLFNDKTYGGDRILKGTTFTKYKQFIDNCFSICNRQALHAKTLGFVHPVTNKFMQFDSDLPEDMSQLIDKWRNYVANREIE